MEHARGAHGRARAYRVGTAERDIGPLNQTGTLLQVRQRTPRGIGIGELGTNTMVQTDELVDILVLNLRDLHDRLVVLGHEELVSVHDLNASGLRKTVRSQFTRRGGRRGVSSRHARPWTRRGEHLSHLGAGSGAIGPSLAPQELELRILLRHTTYSKQAIFWRTSAALRERRPRACESESAASALSTRSSAERARGGWRMSPPRRR